VAPEAPLALMPLVDEVLLVALPLGELVVELDPDGEVDVAAVEPLGEDVALELVAALVSVQLPSDP
jgi:hypothetical protein